MATKTGRTRLVHRLTPGCVALAGGTAAPAVVAVVVLQAERVLVLVVLQVMAATAVVLPPAVRAWLVGPQAAIVGRGGTLVPMGATMPRLCFRRCSLLPTVPHYWF